MPDRPAIEDELIRVRTHCVPLVENGDELRLGGKLSSSGTYYCEHNEHIDLEVLLEPDGGARRTAVVNLRHKQFTWAERSASAATPTAETTPTATAEATWTRYVHPESGHAYLYCAATGESRWDEPPA